MDVRGGAGELVELAAAGEDDGGDLGIAKHGELEGLLQQTVLPLRKGDLPIYLVLYSLQLYLPPAHLLDFSVLQFTNKIRNIIITYVYRNLPSFSFLDLSTNLFYVIHPIYELPHIEIFRFFFS